MQIPCDTPVPDWVPPDAAHYLAHTEGGLPIRALARQAGCHASTVLRQIRRLENRRDDGLVDAALRDLGQRLFAPSTRPGNTRSGTIRQAETGQADTRQAETGHGDALPSDKDCSTMNAYIPTSDLPPDEATLRLEALRVLRRLNEPGAVLAVAQDMDKAVVVRDGAAANGVTAVVALATAQALALKEWIACDAPGRVARYGITQAGRTALAGFVAEAERRATAPGLSEAPAAFAGSARGWRDAAADGDAAATRRRMRYSLTESPLMALARRKDRDGLPFLSDDLVDAGERLREDFELAQMGPRITQNWDRFLTGAERGSSGQPDTRGPGAARERVAIALRALGPGLGDVALRCCCYLEGLEAAEKRMGWSARSGKIVLRIALQRLKAHYDSLGAAGRMIG